MTWFFAQGGGSEVAQAAQVMTQWQFVLQGGAFALLAFLVIWFVKWGLPALLVEQGKRNAEQRQDFLSALNQQRVDHEKWQKEQRDAFTGTLADHDEHFRQLIQLQGQQLDRLTDRIDRIGCIKRSDEN